MSDTPRTRKWREVRAEAVRAGGLEESRVADAGGALVEAMQTYRLQELRKRYARKSQAEIAAALGVTQGRISQIENGDIAHTEVATLVAYAQALGGRLVVGVAFDDADEPLPLISA